MSQIRTFYTAAPYSLAQGQYGTAEVMIKINGRQGFKSLEWAGFICEAGTRASRGKWAKIPATEVCDAEGIWYPVGNDEFVLGWVIENRLVNSRQWIVYGVVDKTGKPIVRPQPPAQKPECDRESMCLE